MGRGGSVPRQARLGWIRALQGGKQSAYPHRSDLQVFPKKGRKNTARDCKVTLGGISTSAALLSLPSLLVLLFFLSLSFLCLSFGFLSFIISLLSSLALLFFPFASLSLLSSFAPLSSVSPLLFTSFPEYDTIQI